MAGEAWVAVPVAGLWRSPEAPRAVDTPALQDDPDHTGWLAAMDQHPVDHHDSRVGLLDRLDSEVLHGEPVEVREELDGWARVTCPLQPAGKSLQPYEGWVRRAHLSHDAPQQPQTASPDRLDAKEFVAEARKYLGLGYLWGGLSPAGLDCSGLVHFSARSLGVVVPRDAGDQQLAAEPVELDQVREGDLYFFAHPGKHVHHVGIVIRPGVMLHAPESGARVVEEDLGEDRLRTLVGAGRITR